MRFKTLLLGSATAFAFAGGAAQAADLSVAEPVDYVRVCDAFGAGFWYIPGTDTCIAISGKVTFETTFADDHEVAPHADYEQHHPFSSGHTGSWEFKTSADFNVMSKSMTDWGPLTAFIAFTTDSDNTKLNPPWEKYPGDSGHVFLGEAYLSIGPVLAGYTGSAFNIGVPFTEGGDDLSDDDTDQIQLSWAMNGFGLVLAVEDPRDRWGSAEENEIPDLIAALSFSAAGWDAKVAFLYGDTRNDSSRAVNGSLGTEIGMWQFEVGALYIETPCDTYGACNHPLTNFAVNDGWAAYVGMQQNWTPNFYTAQHFQWEDDSENGENWDAAFTVGFSPAEDLWMRADASTTNEGDDWELLLQLEKAFGPNG